MNSVILGTGSYLPEKRMTNFDFEKFLETSHEWIMDRTGIVERRIIGENETVTDMAEHAARRAMAAANVSAAEIDLIIVATTTPDKIFPNTACMLQSRLSESVPCPAFDIQAACGGFIYALSVADLYVKTGACRCALVVGVEAMSRLLDWQDRNTAILFGDGAGAVVLGQSEKPGIIATHLHADGRYEHLLTTETRNIAPPGELPIYKDCVQMDAGRDVFKWAVSMLSDVVDETLARNHIQKSDIDWLVPHQANLRIIAATAKKLDLPMERVVVTVNKHGNTSAASIPLALDEAVRDGRIKRGELLLLEAFGAGFGWGSALVRY